MAIPDRGLIPLQKKKKPAPPPPQGKGKGKGKGPKKKRSGWVLLGMVGGGVAVAVAAASLFTVVSQAAQVRERRTQCGNNLRILWQSMDVYRTVYGGQNRQLPSETRGHFWLKLTRTPQPMLQDPNVLFCPVAESLVSVGKTDYRGPLRDANTLEPGDLLGADQDRPRNNHGPGQGGNVVLHNGQVAHYRETDPQWVRAGEFTGP